MRNGIASRGEASMAMPMTTVCVFGGSGFLGRRLVRWLAGEGVTLRVAVRSPERARSVLDLVKSYQIGYSPS